MLDKIPNSIGVAWGVTYGFGANAISASVSSGISNLAIQKETKIREQNVGQGRHFDGRTGKSFKFNVYKTSSGSLKKDLIKLIYHQMLILYKKTWNWRI